MTNFAQALARIEDIIVKDLDRELELEELLVTHADSIVQLAKVAQRMRSGLYDDERGVYEYDKLMKGDTR